MGLSSGITPLRTGRELAGVDSTALLDRIERPAQVLTVYIAVDIINTGRDAPSPKRGDPRAVR
jgi:hypothetical protein